MRGGLLLFENRIQNKRPYQRTERSFAMADITIERGVRTSSMDHPIGADNYPLVSWRSVIAGFFVSFLCLAVLLSLGMAFGGITMDASGASLQGVGLYSGIWFVVSAVISLFAGSYFAARISQYHTNRIGSAQGLVIASLFFVFFLWQTFSAIGWVGRTATNAVGTTAQAVGTGASQAAHSSTVNNIVQQALGDLNLRTDPQTVITGVATRLVQGDVEGAKTYLSAQTGISRAEANRRIDQLQAQVNQAMTQAQATAANALQGVGWSLFVTIVLGAAAAIGGGALGSRANVRKPLAAGEQVEFRGAPAHV